MAMMFNCAVDWTFDLAFADAQKATALPMRRGVRRRCENDGVWLFTVLKTAVKYSVSTTPWDDSWEQNIDWGWVSDVYKDIYGQRPHFDKWYWRGLLGVYQSLRGFEGNRSFMEDKCRAAKWAREGVPALM